MSFLKSGFRFVMSICLGLLLSELIIRALGIAPPLPSGYSNFQPDKYLPYRMAPFDTQHVKTAEFEVTYTTNNHGFRDIEDYSYDKPESEFRILALGDSFTFGAAVQFEESYLHLLEERLRREVNPHVAIVKAGVSNFNSELEYLMLKYYGFKYHPDLILVAFLPNDIAGTYLERTNAARVTKAGYLITRQGEEMGNFMRQLYVYSHIARIVIRHVVYRTINESIRWDEIYRPNGFHEDDWLKLESDYSKMIALASEENIPIVFVHIPQDLTRFPEADYPARRLGSFTRSKGVPFIDTLSEMRRSFQSSSEPHYFKSDGHCTAKGYRVIADSILEGLNSLNLIPSVDRGNH
ncbi:MAG: hypothetical protein KDD70_05645 [Bdellovibrionales bacterium]|nr:hypothetical protein [Bdellovibrionales bacterium]